MVKQRKLSTSLCDLIHIDMAYLYSYTIFDKLKCNNSVSFNLRALKWGGMRYCDTQTQLSGKFTKFIEKQFCRNNFLNKVAGGRPNKKETQTQCFSRTLPEKWSEKIFFHIFFDSSLHALQKQLELSEKDFLFSNTWALSAVYIWFL